MKRPALGSVVFFFAAPGSTAGLMPWLLRRGDPATDTSIAASTAGWLLFAIGLAAVIAAFVQFVREGRGTPAPFAPTERLVVGGLYRWTRNPMYLAVAAMIGGQALAFASVATLWWLAAFMILVWLFVQLYEQPLLRRTYGRQYDDYCQSVPAWWPRLSPWTQP